MAKVFEVDFRTGSWTERCTGISPTIPYGTPSFIKKEKGLALSNRLADLQYASVLPDTLVGDLTIILEINPYSAGSSNAARLFGTEQFYLYHNGTLSSNYITNNDRATSLALGALNKSKWQQITITRTSAGVVCYYLNNGETYVTGSAGTPVASSSKNFLIGCGEIGGSAYYADSLFSRVIIYNTILSEQERTAIYREFLNSYPQEEVKTPDYQAMKPTDLSNEKDSTTDIQLLNTDPTYGFVINDVSKWGKFGNNVIEQSGLYVKITHVDNAAGGYVNNIGSATFVSTAFTNGNRYRVRALVKTNGVGSCDFQIYDGASNFTVISTSATTDQIFDYTITVASATLCYIRCSGMNAGEVGYVQILSIQRVTGLIAAYNFTPQGSTLVDISGNGANLTKLSTGRSVVTKEGIMFYGQSYSLYTSNGYSKGSSLYIFNVNDSFSVSFRIKPTESKTGLIFTNDLCNWNGVSLITTNTAGGILVKFRLGDSTARGVSTTIYNNVYSNVTMIVSRPANKVYTYVNGVYIGEGDSGNNALTNSGFSVASDTDGSWGFTGELSDLRIYNRVLTTTEISAYHNQFAKIITLREDFSKEGADGVSKVPSGWQKSGTSAWKIGEWQPTKGELIGGVLTPTFGWSSLGANAYLYTTNVSNSVLSKGGAIRTGSKYRLKFRVVANPNSTRLRGIDGTGVFFFSNTIFSVGSYIYEDVVDVATPTGFYFRVDGGEPSGLQIDSITLEEIPPLPTFTNGTKYLENVTAGTLAIPSKQAYGTWEFDWYKGSDSTVPMFNFMVSKASAYNQNSNNGHMFYVSVNEGLILYRITASGLVATNLSTANSYITINTWYRIKITRSLAGVFTVYIKGGTFGNTSWTLVSVTGGSGANPFTNINHTTSEYFSIDLDAGDRITNIVFKEGIEV